MADATGSIGPRLPRLSQMRSSDPTPPSRTARALFAVRACSPPIESAAGLVSVRSRVIPYLYSGGLAAVQRSRAISGRYCGR